MPTWIELKEILVELIKFHTLQRIGFATSDFLGWEINYKSSNGVKMLINLKPRMQEIKPIKKITNRSIYKLKYSKYEGRIQ